MCCLEVKSKTEATLVDQLVIPPRNVVNIKAILDGAQRFAFMLETCQPGSVPDAGLLAALLDLVSKKTWHLNMMELAGKVSFNISESSSDSQSDNIHRVLQLCSPLQQGNVAGMDSFWGSGTYGANVNASVRQSRYSFWGKKSKSDAKNCRKDVFPMGRGVNSVVKSVLKRLMRQTNI